ncbi:MAG: hypothetical protein ABJA84_00735 [Polaromonas sp.]
MAFISNTGQTTYKNDLTGVFETLQEQRSVLVAMVREVQLTTRLLVIEEARRLRSDVDPADPRVSRYEIGSSAILRRVAALEVEAQIAGIRVPPVTKTDTLLQGRVTDEASRATAHVTVTLIDENGKPVANVPPVETDDSGYYAFVLQAAQTEAIGPDRKLTLQIGSSSGKLVPAAAVPVTLAPGKVVAAEMRLQASELDALHLRPAFGAVKATAKPPAEEAKTASKPRQTANQDAKPKKKP